MAWRPRPRPRLAPITATRFFVGAVRSKKAGSKTWVPRGDSGGLLTPRSAPRVGLHPRWSDGTGRHHLCSAAHCLRAQVSTRRDRALAARFGACARPLRPPSSGGLGLLTTQLTRALEALLALVFAQDASLVDAGLESPQKLIERLALASFNVHKPRFYPLVPAAACETAGARVGATALLEAGRAVDRLIRAWLERHAGDIAAAGADSLVHLARGAWCAALVATASGIRAPLALGTPRCAAVWTARWLAESTAGVEILLARGKGETLAAVAAGQCDVT